MYNYDIMYKGYKGKWGRITNTSDKRCKQQYLIQRYVSKNFEMVQIIKPQRDSKS